MNFPIHASSIHGDYFIINTPAHPVYFVLDSMGVEQILEKNHFNYKKSWVYQILKLSLGNGLLTSDGSDWKKQRKKTNPLFHTHCIQSMSHQILTSVSSMLNKWSQDNQKEILLNDVMSKLTINIISHCFFGIDSKAFQKFFLKEIFFQNAFLIKRMRHLIRLPLWVPLPNHLTFKQSCQKMHEFLDKIIKKNQSSYESNPNLLSLFLSSNDMNIVDIRNEIITFLVAGHGTTANALCYILYALTQYPKEMNNVRNEILDTHQKSTPTFESTRQLTYTQAFIKEVLRLYPPAWIIGRETIKSDIINGYNIPAGSEIHLPIYAIHRSPKYWNDPEQFRPERFLNTPLSHKFSYLPFGGGPRLCIGMQFAMLEILIILTRIFQNYKISMDQQPLTLEPLITLRPKTKLNLKLEKI